MSSAAFAKARKSLEGLSVGDAFAKARKSLEGLSVGDAFGQQFFFPHVVAQATADNPPPTPWHYTDDTEMALAVVETLIKHGHIQQNDLAQRFAARYQAEPGRGYGAGAHEILSAINRGGRWDELAKNLFRGTGSYGNGAAMRSAPIGAWFSDDTEKVVSETTASAVVTHTHPEGIAGAVAVALATAWVAKNSTDRFRNDPAALLTWVVEQLDPGEVRNLLIEISKESPTKWPFDIAAKYGCGDNMSAQDTVPFCLWMAAAYLHDFEEAMWLTARIGGDIDTNCAIIGGIIGLNPNTQIPRWMIDGREPLGLRTAES